MTTSTIMSTILSEYKKNSMISFAYIIIWIREDTGKNISNQDLEVLISLCGGRQKKIMRKYVWEVSFTKLNARRHGCKDPDLSCK